MENISSKGIGNVQRFSNNWNIQLNQHLRSPMTLFRKEKCQWVSRYLEICELLKSKVLYNWLHIIWEALHHKRENSQWLLKCISYELYVVPSLFNFTLYNLQEFIIPLIPWKCIIVETLPALDNPSTKSESSRCHNFDTHPHIKIFFCTPQHCNSNED